MNPKARIAVAGAGLIGKRHIEMAAKAERAQLDRERQELQQQAAQRSIARIVACRGSKERAHL